MMAGLVLFGLFVLWMALGVPVAVALAAAGNIFWGAGLLGIFSVYT